MLRELFKGKVRGQGLWGGRKKGISKRKKKISNEKIETVGVRIIQRPMAFKDCSGGGQSRFYSETLINGAKGVGTCGKQGEGVGATPVLWKRIRLEIPNRKHK